MDESQTIRLRRCHKRHSHDVYLRRQNKLVYKNYQPISEASQLV